MARFYNPYHFVPVEKPATQDVLREDFKHGKPEHVTHERWTKDALSGRLIVRLRTVTPLVLGADQRRDGDALAVVAPYLVAGRPAVPGSSLRGLIGSTLEAATNAPLRVLEDRRFSFRRKMEDSLSALGLIVQQGERLWLRPMALPTLESRDGGDTFEAPPKFRKIFPQPQFKIYFGDRQQIRTEKFPYRTATREEQAVPMPVKVIGWRGNSVARDYSLHVKGNRFAVAQLANQNDPTRLGYVRVLGCWGDRERDMPHTKTHELWAPLPGKDFPTLPILDSAIERFEALADERTEADPRLPFEPKDTRVRGRGENLRLQAGDMVYFDVNDKGEVTEFSFSAIWRGQVETTPGTAATAHKFFGGLGGKDTKELLPMSAARTTVSLAELMLGFVDSKPEDKVVALSLASRIRFYDALPLPGVEGLLEDRVALKILASPKTPSPAMYFKSAGGGASAPVAKRLLTPARHEPQGRKWYLHGKSEAGQKPWETLKPNDNRKQKNLVQPIPRDRDFYFHVDFENLSVTELGALLFALEPDVTFHHKLGMGKPLGLGSIKVDLMGTFLIDRQKRYTVAGLNVGRYTSGFWTKAGSECRASLGFRYAEAVGLTSGDSSEVTAKNARETFENSGHLNAASLKALRVLGNYEGSPSARSVHYPTVIAGPGSTNLENEHFKWFVFNDGHREKGRGMSPKGQGLKPLTGQQSTLPDLEELTWEEDTRGGRW